MDRTALALHIVPETQLRQQLEREHLPAGIVAFDQAFGGVPRGTVTEIFGPESSGKTSFFSQFLSRATSAGEFCALVDGNDTFDPAAAEAAGADLRRLLWVRCRGVEESLKAADLLVHSGGWGVVVLDLAGIPSAAVRKVPMSWWYRFRRAVENTPTAFLVIESEPYVKNCAVMALEFLPSQAGWSGSHRNFLLMRGTGIRVKPRKPLHNHIVTFHSDWNGAR